MNDLDMTTHIDSLDADRVIVPHLDVDSALDSTITRGEKIARDRKIARALQVSIVLAFIFLIGAGAIRFFDSPTKTVATKKLAKVDTKVLGKQETNTVASVIAPVEQPETTQATAPLPAPATIAFGDPSTCAMVTGSGSDGIDIGTSQSAEKWSPAMNETKTISIGENGKTITLKNIANSDAATGQSVTLVGNIDQTNSYADISARGFAYCFDGYSLAISQESNGSYLLTTLMR